MREKLGSTNELNNKKNSKSRRRLHEAEVLSTTPCTAPVRRPQQDSSNIRSSLRGLSLDGQNQQLPPVANSVTSSAGATIDEYNRISNKTGGFEGALPLQYDAIFPNDDNTVHFDCTVKSSPELGQKAARQKINGGRDTATTRRRLFQRQRRSFVAGDDKPSAKFNFFNRWTSIGTASSKDQNFTSSSFGTTPRRNVKQQTNRTSSREATCVTIENSEKSVSKSVSNITVALTTCVS